LGDKTNARLSQDKSKNDSIIEFFSKDRFRISKTNVSYKQANDLEKAGLLPSSRLDTNESGWRLFNFKDVIYLDVLLTLKKFGMTYKQLEPLKDLFYNNDRINDLLLACGYGIEITLTIYDSGRGFAYDPEELLSKENDALFALFLGDITTHLRLSLNDYFNKALKTDGKLGVAIHRSISLMAWRVLATDSELTDAERRILMTLRDTDVQEVSVRKKNGKPMVIYAQNETSNSMTIDEAFGKIRELAYADVELKVRDGKIVFYQKEETTKLS